MISSVWYIWNNTLNEVQESKTYTYVTILVTSPSHRNPVCPSLPQPPELTTTRNFLSSPFLYSFTRNISNKNVPYGLWKCLMRALAFLAAPVGAFIFTRYTLPYFLESFLLSRNIFAVSRVLLLNSQCEHSCMCLLLQRQKSPSTSGLYNFTWSLQPYLYKTTPNCLPSSWTNSHIHHVSIAPNPGKH